MTNYLRFAFPAFMLISLTVACSGGKGTIGRHYISEIVDSEVYSRYTTVYAHENKVDVYYSDEVTLSIKHAHKENNQWQISSIDKVDVDDRINPVIGKHFIEYKDGVEHVFYPDYQSEKKNVFKYLTKKEGDTEYVLDSLPVSCSDFCFVEGDASVLFYIDGALKVLQNGEAGKWTPVQLDPAPFVDIIDFMAFKTADSYTLIYTDAKGTLNLVTMQLENSAFNVTGKQRVSDEVTLFDAVQRDGKIALLYYEKNNLLTLYRDQVRTKVGYYPAVSGVDVGYTSDHVLYFVVAAIEKSTASSDVYSVFVIHQDLKKAVWYEEKIAESDMPVMTIDSASDSGYLYIGFSGNILQLVTIPLKYMWHR